MNEIKYPFPLTVKSQGDSIWVDVGSSEYDIEIVEVEKINYVDPKNPNKVYLSIDLFGPNLPWTIYTDTGVEGHLEPVIRDYIFHTLGLELISFGWSEQGLQHDGNWNFDGVAVKQNN